MEKIEVLLINPGQFGYRAGYYYYAKYLREDCNVNIICHDQGLPYITLDNVQIKYVSFKGNKLKRDFHWLVSLFHTIKRTKKKSVIFMSYFKFCFLFGMLFPERQIILDIRTGSIFKNKITNYLQNKQFLFESLFFKHINILSKGLIKLLQINSNRCHWLPLGSESLSKKKKTFKSLNLLYVGTLTGREIHETVKGLRLFLDNYEYTGKISYDIFGFGSLDEVQSIHKAITNNALKDVVVYHGQQNHQQLKPYFDKCNIGVSYVPMTPYYEYQPPTKTFEYILSGMVCIATNTYENRALVNIDNGVLCDDDPDSFSKALQQICLNKKEYSFSLIRNSLSGYHWEKIVKGNLLPYLNTIN